MMLNIVIDGQKVKAKEGSTILEKCPHIEDRDSHPLPSR